MADTLVSSPTEMSRITVVSVHNTSAADNDDRESTGYSHLTPRARSPHDVERMRTSGFELEWYDDACHEEYEWLRLPKKRDWDILSFLKHTPEQRNTANTPLTIPRYDGKDVVMWAKMDTGADVNIINESTLSALLGHTASNWKKPLKDNPELSGFTNLGLIGDQHFEPTDYVELNFRAGTSRNKFAFIPFVVVPDDAVKAAHDGVPNVILGVRTLWEYHMVMIDIEYLNEPDDMLEVIAEKAEEERSGGGYLGPIIKYKPPPPGTGPRLGAQVKRRNTKITMAADGARVQSWGL